MLGVRLPEELESRLTALSAKTNRSKSFYVKKALEKFLEDEEDYLIAIEAYEDYLRSGKKEYSLEEVAKANGIV